MEKQKILRSKNLLNLDINYFKQIDTNEKAYWLGYIAADGYIEKNACSIILTSKDLEVIEKFRKAIKSEHALRKKECLDKRSNNISIIYQIKVCSKDFTKFIIDKGITNKKSMECNFPNIKEEFKSHFLRGLFDGDGSIYIRGNQIQVYQLSTKNILNEIIKTLDLKFFTLVEIKNKSNYDLNRLYFNKENITFLNYIYENSTEEIRLNRKYEIYLKRKKLLLDKPKPFKCKHCDGNNTYRFGFNRKKELPRQIIYCRDCKRKFINKEISNETK